MPSEYYLNGRPLSDFGFVPGHAEGSNIALSGAWDMPKRLGDCYYTWQDRDGVEPYVEAEDMVFGARAIRLTGTIIAADRLRFRERLEAFHAFITSLPAVFELRCAWGVWAVNCKAETRIEVKGTCAGFVTLVFNEPTPDVSGTWPRQWILATGVWNGRGEWVDGKLWYVPANPYGDRTDIDEWLWESFGLALSAVDDASVIPAARGIKVTQPVRETLYAPGGREPRSLTLSGWVSAADMTEFGERVRSLYWLFGSAGLRELHHHGRIYSCFATEGFSLTDIQKRDKVFAKFKIKLLESGNE